VNRSREVMVGLVIILGILVTVAGTLWLQGSSFGRETIRVEAVVLEAGQLLDGNPVKVRGVPIGRVRDIRVDPAGDAVRIVMEVDAGVAFPADPGVIVAPESLFGDWQVEIVSRAAYPRYAFLEIRQASEDGAMVLPGYALPDLSRLTATADEIAQNITVLTERVETAFTDETAENIRGAIDNIQQVSQQLADLVGQQGAAVQAVTEEVARAATEVGDAAAAARVSFQELERMMEGRQLDSILLDTRATMANLREVSEGLEETNASARTAMARADTVLGGLSRVTGRIEAGEGTLGRLLADDGVAVRTEEALNQLNMLLQDIRENPRRYVRLSIF